MLRRDAGRGRWGAVRLRLKLVGGIVNASPTFAAASNHP